MTSSSLVPVSLLLVSTLAAVGLAGCTADLDINVDDHGASADGSASDHHGHGVSFGASGGHDHDDHDHDDHDEWTSGDT